MADQPRLFDLPEPEEVKHPGQLSLHDWLKRPDTVYHASFRPDWEQAERVHVGTQTAASDRLVQVAVNTASPVANDADRGRIFARRMVNPPAMTISDSNANSADFNIRWSASNPHYRTRYAAESDRPDIHQAINRLQRGEPVGYKNYAEDQGSISSIVPRGGLRAYHEDVAEARSMGLSTHNHVVDVVSSQLDPAVSITPRSMQNAANAYRARYGEPEQGSLFPHSVIHEHTSLNDVGVEQTHRTETLFESRPDDPDWTGHTRVAGYSAAERANAFAEATGGKMGYGVRERHKYNKPFPSDIPDVERAHHEVLERRKYARKHEGKQ